MSTNMRIEKGGQWISGFNSQILMVKFIKSFGNSFLLNSFYPSFCLIFVPTTFHYKSPLKHVLRLQNHIEHQGAKQPILPGASMSGSTQAKASSAFGGHGWNNEWDKWRKNQRKWWIYWRKWKRKFGRENGGRMHWPNWLGCHCPFEHFNMDWKHFIGPEWTKTIQ